MSRAIDETTHIPAEAIARILDYLEHDERRDFECRRGIVRASHVYNSVMAVRKWLEEHKPREGTPRVDVPTTNTTATNVLQNLDRWLPRLKVIREYQEKNSLDEDDFGIATLALEKAGQLEELTVDSFAAPLVEFAKTINAGGRGPRSVTDDVGHIVERARPLLEQHKQEIFEIFIKCLLLEFDTDVLAPMFYEMRGAIFKTMDDDDEEIEAA